jgi:hypothetical protein
MDKQKENSEIDVDEMLEKIKSYFGFVPKIFQVLSENPAALKAFYDKAETFDKGIRLHRCRSSHRISTLSPYPFGCSPGVWGVR